MQRVRQLGQLVGALFIALLALPAGAGASALATPSLAPLVHGGALSGGAGGLSANLSTHVTNFHRRGGVAYPLATGGTITGTVSGPSGPLANVCVGVYEYFVSGAKGTATTASDGTYTITGLPAGSAYIISFAADCGVSPQNYVSQTISGVSVTAGSSTTESVTLVAGGTITGTVSGPSGVLANVCVNVYEPGVSGADGSATTASDGTYTIIGLPTGTAYSISFAAGCGAPLQNFISQTVSGVSVTAGSSTTESVTLVAGGIITGTVSGPNGPLANVCVTARESGVAGANGSAATASDGTYTITGLPTGTAYSISTSAGCQVLIQPLNVLDQSVVGVSVTAGSTTTEDFVLTAGGVVTGTVSGPNGALDNVCVMVQEPGVASAYGFAMTAVDGSYSIVGLPTGTAYNVSLNAQCNGSNQNYVSQTISGVPVTAGSSTTENVTLAAGGTITGTVSGPSGPLANVCVDAYETGVAGADGSATTASDGTYTIVGLPTGTSYSVSTTANCYGPTSLRNVIDQTVSPVSVTAGSPTTENFALAVGGTITGTVSGPSGVLANVCVTANDANVSGAYGFAITASDGTYTIVGLPTGTAYSVTFNAKCTRSPQNYVNQSISPVSVTAGSSTTQNVTLAAGGTITGTVSGPSGVLANVCVRAVENGVVGAGGSTRTATNGSYTITGLPAGTSYSVSFNAQCTASTQNYVNQMISPVSVTVGSSTTENVTLAAGGTITGTVSGSGGPLEGVCVTIYDSSGTTVANLSTDVNGQFDVSGLSVGDYAISVNAQCGSSPLDYVNQSVTGVSVVAGSNASSVTFDLVAGSEITGTVTDATSGSQLANVCVAANGNGSGVGNNSAMTNANGTYTIVGLPAGTYNVTASADCNGTNANYVAQTVAGVVTSSASPTMLNFALPTGGQVTGVVTGNGGAPMADVCVSAIQQNSVGVVGNAVSVANGTYTIMGLPAGSYRVEIVPQCGSTPQNVTAAALTGVVVTAGATTSGVNFVLSNVSAPPPSTPPTPPAPPSSAPPPTGVPSADLGTPMSTLITGVGGSLDLSSLTESSTLNVPAGALPAGTLVSEFPITNTTALAADVPPGQSFVLAVAVTWVAPSGASPVASPPLTMTISDPGIVVGDNVYMLTASGLQLVGAATANGSISFSVTTDPIFVVTSAALAVSQSTLQVTTTHGVAGTALTLSAVGGSGTGAVTYSVTDGTATGCRVTNGELFAASAGTCLVVATKSASAGYLATSSPATAVSMARPAAPAALVVGMAPAQRLLTNHDRAVIAALSRKLLAGASVVIYGYAKGDRAVARERAAAAAAYLASLIKVHVRLAEVTRVAANEFRIITTSQ